MRLFLIATLLLAVLFSADAQSIPRADDGSQIDLMVIYTPAGRAQMGGTLADVYADITAAVASTNADLATAGVSTTLALVHLRELFYLEQLNGDPDQDLLNLIGTADGLLDDVHMLRDFYAADLVILIAGSQFALYTDNSPILSPADDTQAFGIVEGRYLTASNNHANFRRVVGHLLGVADETPIDIANTAALNAALPATAQYRDSADRMLPSWEMLNNGGFELDADLDSIPDFWARMPGSSAQDKRVCKPAKAYIGSCALRLTGVAGVSVGFRQVLNNPTLLLGDQIVLTARGASTPSMTTGAAVKLLIVFETLPKLKIVLPVSPDSGDYGASPLMAALTVNDGISKIKVIAKFGGATASGTAWFDDFSLMANSGVFAPLRR